MRKREQAVEIARLALADAARQVQLRARLHAPLEGAPGVVIGVTSAHRGEGKTTVALALAHSLQQDFEVDVAIVDADFATHSVGDAMGINGVAGLYEVLGGHATIEDVSRKTGSTPLTVVTAGTVGREHAPGIRSQRTQDAIERLRREHQFVVLDLPATLPSPVAATLAQLCDVVFLVIQTGRTTTAEVEEAVERLRDAPVEGVLLNRWKTRIPRWLERRLRLRR